MNRKAKIGIGVGAVVVLAILLAIFCGSSSKTANNENATQVTDLQKQVADLKQQLKVAEAKKTPAEDAELQRRTEGLAERLDEANKAVDESRRALDTRRTGAQRPAASGAPIAPPPVASVPTSPLTLTLATTRNTKDEVADIKEKEQRLRDRIEYLRDEIEKTDLFMSAMEDVATRSTTKDPQIKMERRAQIRGLKEKITNLKNELEKAQTELRDFLSAKR